MCRSNQAFSGTFVCMLSIKNSTILCFSPASKSGFLSEYLKKQKVMSSRCCTLYVKRNKMFQIVYMSINRNHHIIKNNKL